MTPPDSADAQEAAPSQWKLVAAGAVGIAVTLAVNAFAAWFLQCADLQEAVDEGVSSAYFSFYDGCVVLFTLVVPAFLGGLALASIARGEALKVSIAAFGAAAIVGLWHPYWQVRFVSPYAVHNRMVYYMLHNPIVIVAFGTFGAWLGGEFATGRFSLNDREPVHVPGSEDNN
jgi:hypothetical protein